MLKNARPDSNYRKYLDISIFIAVVSYIFPMSPNRPTPANSYLRVYVLPANETVGGEWRKKGS